MTRQKNYKRAKASEHKYRPDIDGLRAMAVISVVIFHFFPHRLQGGYLGVDVFFVISGYLITYIILKDIYKNQFSLVNFYKRRIRRIFPALILTFILVIVLGYITLLSHEFRQLCKHVIGGGLFIPNFIFWNEAGYFDTVSYTKPLLHIWSLGIEEQFYLFWPLLLWFLSNKRRHQFVFIVLTIICSFSLWCYLNETDSTAAFYLPFSRFWELGFGSGIAYLNLYLHNKYFFSTTYNKQFDNIKVKILFEVLSLAGISMILLSIFKTNKNHDLYTYFMLAPVIGTALVIFSGQHTFINKYILSNRIFVWFGLISYPLYLIHWPFYSYSYILENGVPNRDIRIVAIIVSILVSWLIFSYIEKPIRFGKIYAKKNVSLILIILMIAIGSIGCSIYLQDGLPGRFKSKDKLHYVLKNPEPEVVGCNCADYIPELSEFNRIENCILNTPKLPEIAFVGDSHLRMYRKSIFDKFSNKPLMMFIRPTCFPFVYPNPSKVTEDCLEKIEILNNYLREQNSVKTVIITGFWAYLMAGDFLEADTDIRIPQKLSKETREVFILKANEFIESAREGGKHLILIQDIPHLDFPILSSIDVRPIRITEREFKDGFMSKQKFEEYIKPYDDVLNIILNQHPNIDYYDPRPLFCDKTKCKATQGEFPLYRNGDHLNFLGADIVIDDFISKFPKLNE